MREKSKDARKDAEPEKADKVTSEVADPEAEVTERTPPELGPVVPPGEGAEPPAFEQVGSATGVQPMTEDEIPESGR